MIALSIPSEWVKNFYDASFRGLVKIKISKIKIISKYNHSVITQPQGLKTTLDGMERPRLATEK